MLLHVQDEAKDLQPEQKDKAAAEDRFDINQDRHKGQFALRKLYHESDRVIVVLYSAPTCGPCRTLKPIFSKVVDEYEKKVCFLQAHFVAQNLLLGCCATCLCCWCYWKAFCLPYACPATSVVCFRSSSSLTLDKYRNLYQGGIDCCRCTLWRLTLSRTHR